MTSVMIKTEEQSLRQELSKLAAKFPNWKFFYEFNDSVSDPVDAIKSVIKEMKIKYPNYHFSICQNSYNSLLILNIRSVDRTEEFAYFGGNDCGFIVCNDMYRILANEFKNNSDLSLLNIRVFNYIENSRTMQLEFKQY